MDLGKQLESAKSHQQLMQCDQNENKWVFFFFLEFGFGKQKGNEKQQKGKAYNLMQCDQKRRTGGVFFFFFFGNLVLLENRREMRNNRREKRII